MTCLSCHYSCATCAGGTETSCNSCALNADSHRTISGNVCACDDGYFDHGSSANCVICHSSCRTCDGSSNTDCKSC